MKKIAFPIVLFTGILLLFAQCGSAEIGEKVANKFFSSILKRDFTKAASMVQRPALGDTTDIVSQLRLIENNTNYGQLKSFKKSMGFNTNISNGVTTIKLPYRLTYENGVQNFQVMIQNNGGGYKIVSVQ